jgi:hypothetical protein
VLFRSIYGRSEEPERTGFKGRIGLTDFSFRGEALSSFETVLDYTNRALTLINPRALRGEEEGRAEGLLVDFDREVIFLTNGFSTLEPMVVCRAIGPRIAHTIEPYHFDRPPVARVNGTIPLRGEEQADLHFDLVSGPFHWWKLNVARVSGHLHWQGLHLSLRDLVMDFYSGAANGSAEFDFPREKKGTDFKFTLAMTNALLQPLINDLFTRTNRLEGALSGTVAVTQANTESWDSVYGYGKLELRDGLLWDIPVFGIFSPVLNGIAPGLGNLKATAGTATFVMTQGLIRSEDLEIRSPTVRLLYRGTVDFEAKVNARVEAELLRDMWLVGPIVSTVLWPVSKMFEYKVTGTLDEPKAVPVYIIPKIVLMPLHPFRTLKSLLPSEAPPRTNSPPPFPNSDAR